jgi:hypothetical protein
MLAFKCYYNYLEYLYGIRWSRLFQFKYVYTIAIAALISMTEAVSFAALIAPLHKSVVQMHFSQPPSGSHPPALVTRKLHILEAKISNWKIVIFDFSFIKRVIYQAFQGRHTYNKRHTKLRRNPLRVRLRPSS